MSGARERSAGPASAQPRMLRIEYKGQPYDWFNLDEMGDIVRTNDFANTLRENITHYFGVPFEHQVIYDEEGILSSMVDFSRALRSVRPWLRVYDTREMAAELKEKTTKQLEEVQAEVMRLQRSLGGFGVGYGAAGLTQQLYSSPVQNGYSPPRGQRERENALYGGYSPPRGQRDTSLSLADAVKNASEYGSLGGPSQFAAPKPVQPTAFPWGGANFMEAYSARNGVAPRYGTPPPQSYQGGSQIPGVIPSQARAGGYGSPWIPPSAQAPQGQRQMYSSSSQPQLPSYGAGPAMATGLPSQPHHAIGSSTPPMAQRGIIQNAAAPQDAYRQGSTPGVAPGNARGADTSARPPPGAVAAAALAQPAPASIQHRDKGEAGGYAQREISMSRDQTPRNTFQVVLEKDATFQRFGFANVPLPDNRGLVISWVDRSQNGLLEMKWNRMASVDQQVNENDHIISVNGRIEDVDTMRDQLQVPTVHLVIRKAGKQAS